MLTSLQNPLVKHIRKLHQAKGRHIHQQFLLEGSHLVQEAYLARYPLDVVCATPAWGDRYPDLWTNLLGYARRVEIVSPDVLAAIATTIHPDGVVAIAPHQEPPPTETTLNLGVAIETLQDPGNLGTLIRTAMAAGADGLWLSQDSVDPEHPKVLRASAGQWFRLPVQVSPNLPAQVETWRAAGIQVLATSAQTELDYWAVDYGVPTVILLGNEGAGLSPGLLELASQPVRIPMHPAVESLNVAIAATLMLYEAMRQRRESSMVLSTLNSGC